MALHLFNSFFTKAGSALTDLNIYMANKYLCTIIYTCIQLWQLTHKNQINWHDSIKIKSVTGTWETTLKKTEVKNNVDYLVENQELQGIEENYILVKVLQGIEVYGFVIPVCYTWCI